MADRQTEHNPNAHFYAAHIFKVLGQLNENCKRRCILSANVFLICKTIFFKMAKSAKEDPLWIISYQCENNLPKTLGGDRFEK